MVARITKLAAGLTACVLLSGCALLRAGSALERQIIGMSAWEDVKLVAGLVVTPNPDETAVAFRLPGEDFWMGATRHATWPEQFATQPRGGVLITDLPYQGLQTQLDELQEQCVDSPRIVAFVAPSGTVFSESHCGQGAADEVVTTWLDGEPFVGPELDLNAPDGYERLWREVVAAMPNPSIFQIAIPGPGAAADAPVRVQGAGWVLPDQTQCQVRYSRKLGALPGVPLREYDCAGLGPQLGEDDSQDELILAEFSGAELAQQIAAAQAASGFEPELIEQYLLMKLYFGGMSIAVQTVDGEQYQHSF